ncbi:hypothetical protein ID866_8126 [Astraeus odoratus]|nr:hypothetical protein ID866_8126 [Astraeus odoratus]
MAYPYCGKTCARYSPISSYAKPRTCKIVGCNNAEDPTLQYFCSEDHARRAVRFGLVLGCARCKVLPQSSGKMCVRCAQIPSDDIQISVVSNPGTLWREFKREWNDRWTDGPPATIEKLFEISYPPAMLAGKESYSQGLKSIGRVRVARTFHASQCICDLGTKKIALCSWKSCGICNIIGTAFKAVAFGAPHHSGSQGDGLYSYTNPSLADRHATSCMSSPYRVMIACDVAMSQFPNNDSQIQTGDQVVVRDSAAIIPRYVILYTKQK